MTESRVPIGGVPVDPLSRPGAAALFAAVLAAEQDVPTAVASANLDHLHHFRHGELGGPVRWLVLPDGWPVAVAASVVLRRRVPRLAGSDLLPQLLQMAGERAITVAFVGGRREHEESLRGIVTAGASFGGHWTPAREELADAQAMTALAADVRAAGVDLLVVGLGKPRQEDWIATYGHLTGARLIVAFGAASEFLIGAQTRAPRVVRAIGLEWAWRLAQSPRRLARRYFIEGPAALWRIVRAW